MMVGATYRQMGKPTKTVSYSSILARVPAMAGREAGSSISMELQLFCFASSNQQRYMAFPTGGRTGHSARPQPPIYQAQDTKFFLRTTESFNYHQFIIKFSALLLCLIPIVWYEITINRPPIFTNEVFKRFVV